jgi:hypothetical protein
MTYLARSIELSLKLDRERIACHESVPSGAGQGKRLNKRKSTDRLLSGGRVSSFKGGVLQYYTKSAITLQNIYIYANSFIYNNLVLVCPQIDFKRCFC